MGQPIVAYSGTVTTDGTEQTIKDFSSGSNAIGGIYKLVLDTTNMASGNTTVVRIYRKIDASNFVKVSETTYTNAQTPAGKETEFSNVLGARSAKVTIQRTAGADRSYAWFIERF